MDFLTPKDQIVSFIKVMAARVTSRLLKNAALVDRKKKKLFNSAATLSNGQLTKELANSTGAQISCIRRVT